MRDAWKFAAVAAASLFAVFAILGFEQKTDKYGVVDVARVFNDSDYTKRQNEQLRAVGLARTGVLDFMQNYQVFTPEAATRFRDLSLKASRTPAEDAELDKIKKDVQASDKAFKDLQTKASPTPDEVAQLKDYNDRIRSTSDLSQRWAQEFDNEVHDLNDKMRTQTLTRVNQAIAQVGEKRGFSVLFSFEAAPYGANDVTDDTIKVMNSLKD